MAASNIAELSDDDIMAWCGLYVILWPLSRQCMTCASWEIVGRGREKYENPLVLEKAIIIVASKVCVCICNNYYYYQNICRNLNVSIIIK